MRTAEEMRARTAQQRKARRKAHDEACERLEEGWGDRIHRALEEQYRNDTPEDGLEVTEPGAFNTLSWSDRVAVASQVACALHKTLGFAATVTKGSDGDRIIIIIKVRWSPLADMAPERGDRGACPEPFSPHPLNHLEDR